ncbi:MAG: lytic transglycosylase domain-containing protein [Terriglobales bacterium]
MKSVAHFAFFVALLAPAAWSADSALPPAAERAPAGMVLVATLQNGFTVRFDHRQQIADTSRLFTSAGDNDYMDVPTAQIASLSQEPLPPAPPPAAAPVHDVKQAVAAASDKHLLDADLIDSVIRHESNFNAKAVSPKGARGLMQLMPGTAAKLGVQDSFDPDANVDAGTRYLRELLARYHNDLAKALAAYNAGPQRVDQYRGVPPYRETRAYVGNIIRDYNRKKLAGRKTSSVSHGSSTRARESETRTTQSRKSSAKKAAQRTAAAQPKAAAMPRS